MNSNLTQRWLMPMLTTALLMLSVARASAQCTLDPLPLYAPIPTFNLSVDAVAPGVADLNGFVVSSFFVSDCPYLFTRFYDAASGGTYLGNSLSFSCADVGSSFTYWVSVRNVVNSPASESPRRQITVNIVDTSVPVSGMGSFDVSLNTSDGTPGDCSVTDLFTSSAGAIDISIFGIDNGGPAPLPQEFADNCIDYTTVTYTLSGATVQAESPAPLGFGPNTYDAGLATFNVGTTLVTYHVYDDLVDPMHLSPLDITVNVTVTDDENPTVTCPATQNVSTDPATCTYQMTNLAAAAYTDNCAVTALTWSAPGATPAASALTGINTLTANFPIGTTTVTFQAKDAGGLTSTCTFDVVVTDNELPTITCPANMTVSASGPPPFPCEYVAVGTEFDYTGSGDNCGVVSIVNDVNFTNTLAGQSFLYGGITPPIVWTATDAQGNTATCSFTLTIIDDVPPIGPAAGQTINVNVTPGDCSASVTYEYPGLLFYDPSSSDCSPNVTLSEGIPVVNGVADPNFLSGLPAFTQDCGRMNLICGAGATLQFPVGQTIISYTWTDQANNKTTEYITVNVAENIPPTANCLVSTITLPLNAAGQASITAAMIDNGSSDNCGLDTITVSPNTFNCMNLATNQTVTLTVTDLAGATATCTATIDVVDNLPPQIVCPSNQSVTTNSGCTAINLSNLGLSAGMIGSLAPGQYADNCGVSSVSWQLTGATTGMGTGSIPGATAFNKGVTTVTYTVADADGNNAVCNFSVNVLDNTPPQWNGDGQAPGSTLTVNANIGGCLAQVSWTEPTFTDACTSVPPVIVTKTHTPGAFFVFGMTTVTYTAIDGVGNVATHTFKVNVVDTQAPVAKCKNITAALDAMGTVTVTAPQVDNLSTDNCFFTFTSPNVVYTCNNLGTNTYTLQITDGSGNTSTCASTVTVVDNLLPVALCNNVSPIELEPDGTYLLNAAVVDNNSTDNTFPACPMGYDISFNGSAYDALYEFNCADLGTHVLTLKVTDAAGNTAVCTQNVLVKDVTSPAITAPANVTISCDASTAPANTGTFSGVSDNCDLSVEVVQLADLVLPGLCLNSKTIIRTWKASDDSGNTTTVSQSIFVQDVVQPVFTVEDEINLQTDDPNFCDAPLTLAITASNVSDNCSDFSQLSLSYTIDYPTPDYGFVDVLVPVAGDTIPVAFFPIGTTVVTWFVSDACGNTSSVSQTINVDDTQAPIFFNGYESNCGKTYVFPNTTGSCSNLFTWARPNSFFGHVGDCLDFTITENIDNATVSVPVNLTNPFDYNATFSFQVFPTAQFPVGVTTVSYIATDAVGNSSTCSFTVEVQDVQAPALTCPPNQILAATCPTAQIPNYTNLVQVADNCPGNVAVTQSIAPGTTLGAIFAPNAPAAGNQFSIVITGDEGYNTSTCTFTVTLVDGDAPIPTVAVLPALIDSCGTLVVFAPSATDPCNPNAPTIYGTPSTPVGPFLNTNPPSYQLSPGNYVITWVYNDGNGNISTQPQNITVLVDNFPPVAICVPNLTLNLDPVTGAVSVLPTQLNNGSYDPNDCGPLTYSVSPATLNCSNAGPSPTAVTLTVKDAKDNPATCSTTITVKDVTSPILSTPPVNITIEACDTIPAPVTLTATDACAGTSTITPIQVSTQDTTGGLLKYNYVITRTWTTSDPSGNTAVATRTITVKDTKKPQFVGAPAMVMVTTDPDRVTCDDTVTFNILPFVQDCATGADLSVTNNKEPGDGANLSAIFAVGTHTVVFTATDISGNSATYALTVVVKDGTPPTAVCINGVSASLQPSGTVVVNVAQFNNNSYDNCSANLSLKIQRLDKLPLETPTNSLTYDCNDADGATQHPVKLFVTDAAGNVSMCETYIVIQDNVDPTITLCPTDKTVPCTDSLSTQDHGTAIATDNCPNNVTMSFEDLAEPDTSGQYCYLIHRVWIASDLANNSATCVQTFNIVDTVAPVLSQYPVNITISCSENLSPPSNITASDNCSDSLAVMFVQDTTDIAQGLCGKYSYKVTRTRTAVDDCGNTISYTNTITVVDDEAPQFLGMPDTITVQSANFPANQNCLVPVTFDVSQYLFDCAPVGELLVLNDAPQGNDSLIASGNYAVGAYLIHFTATDPCGNVGEDSVVVNVIDNSKPTAICNNNVVISLGTDGQATIQADDIDLGSSDNCGIDTMFLNASTFDCADLGPQAVTLTVVDPYGNSNTCTVNVNVTLGNGAGFNLTTTGTAETYFGADNGSATALASGGSGTFTYSWSNNGNTATINNLGAGVYTVSVTDTGTGCVQTDTAIVQAGAKLTITVGNVSGTQGAIVQVPVTVTNFNAMVGLSFSMNVTNATVGTIVGNTNVNAALGSPAITVVGTSLTVFWANATPLTLANGDKLFDLNVQLGTAPVGSTSPVTIDGTPTVLSFQQDSLGTIVATMANLVPGSVTIDAVAADDIIISGLIKTWAGAGTPVPGVTVGLTGSVTNSVITDVPGTYSFTLPSPTTGTITPKKSVTSNFSQGINVGDLLAIQNHAASVLTLSSPFQYVAGDVNNNGKVDLPDYLLVQQLILGTVQHYSNAAPDWKFIPTNYVFPSPNPLSVPYPQTASFACCYDSIMDFNAIRIGDVTGNAPVNNISNQVDNRSGNTFQFRLEEQSVRAGELISVPFKASDFTGRQAYQMTITFDPNVLELADLNMGALPGLSNANFGTAHLADGYLTTLWVSVDPLTLPEGEVLFTLTFKALADETSLSNVLRPGSSVTYAEALDADGNSMDIEFDWAQALANNDLDRSTFALYQNQPNPFRSETTIGFRLPQAGRAALRVYSTDGRLVKTVVGNFSQGYNVVEFRKDEFGAPGVYWYELETPMYSDRKKMILID
ncbi:MAG: HYR domain-containing protein [Saprospiraceae bacterium]|nr:HYR domain-containing protein [Saprospiraceae bacterium]